MTTDRIVHIFAGAMILVSLALAIPASPVFVSQHFFWLTGFVGLNLFQSGFTKLCPLDTILQRVFHVPGGGQCGTGPGAVKS